MQQYRHNAEPNGNIDVHEDITLETLIRYAFIANLDVLDYATGDVELNC